MAEAGHWEGFGTNEVSFDVTESGTVTNFRILIDGDCDVEVTVDAEIGADGSFHFGQIDAEGAPIEDGIVGTFDTMESASGSFASPWKCGTAASYTAMYLPSAMTTWSAELVGP